MRHLQLVRRRGLGQRQKLERAVDDAGMQASSTARSSF